MIIKKSDLLEQPPGNLTIWRYLDITKFLDLIMNQRLFFINMKNLSDQYEASLPMSTIEEERRRLAKKGFKDRDLEEGIASYIYNSGHLLRDLNLVNSWSAGESESYALWKIYVGNRLAGAAIKSSVSRLTSAIEKGDDPYPEDLYVGRVQYQDSIPKCDVNRFSLMMTKKTYYRYENEIRACILHFPRSEGGVATPYDSSIGRYVRVDISELIDEIYLSPFMGKWVLEIIESILSICRPEIKALLVKSEMRDS
ncbi:MAG: hypothetical protein V3V99_02105 [candidate division Zixibacteria bacterium]